MAAYKNGSISKLVVDRHEDMFEGKNCSEDTFFTITW